MVVSGGREGEEGGQLEVHFSGNSLTVVTIACTAMGTIGLVVGETKGMHVGRAPSPRLKPHRGVNEVSFLCHFDSL